MTVLGLGAQDSFDEAQEFVAAYGTESFPMFWDQSFQSWLQLGVSSQPFWILYDGDGQQVAAAGGAVDLALVASVTS